MFSRDVFVQENNENDLEEGPPQGIGRENMGERVQGGPTNRVLRNLMYREFGFGTTHKSTTKNLEPLAETKLVLKDHKELVDT